MNPQDVLAARDVLARAYLAALETYGDAARAAMPLFVAGTVHREEHMIADPNARLIALGQWTSAFHFALETVDADCDAQQGTVAAMMVEHPPAGQA